MLGLGRHHHDAFAGFGSWWCSACPCRGHKDKATLHGLQGLRLSWGFAVLKPRAAAGTPQGFSQGKLPQEAQGCSQFSLAWGKWCPGVLAEDEAAGETLSVPLAQGVKSRGSSGIRFTNTARPFTSSTGSGQQGWLHSPSDVPPSQKLSPSCPGVPFLSSLSCHWNQQIWDFPVIAPNTAMAHTSHGDPAVAEDRRAPASWEQEGIPSKGQGLLLPPCCQARLRFWCGIQG